MMRRTANLGTRNRLVALMALLVAIVFVQQAATAASGEARDLALAALRLEFERDGVTAVSAVLDQRFQTACDKGYNPACRRPNWLVNGRPDVQRALDVFQPSCDAGDQVACLVTAWCNDTIGKGQANADERDRTWRKAARQLKTDCESGFQAACHDYAGFLYENKGIVSDPEPALRRWKSACDAREWASCTKLAKLYAEGGIGVAQSTASAQSLADKACTGGYAEGCALYGTMVDGRFDAAKLDSFYGGLCDSGHRDSCWRLARAYFDGIYPEPVEGRLRGLLLKGCELGHAQSCAEAGRFAMDTDGDVAAAAGRFGQACDLGDASGCSLQVDLILSGRAPGNVKTALHAFNVACDLRQSIPACSVLAYALIDGAEVPRNAERGRALLQRVCKNEEGDPKACMVLGRSFEEGFGGERDRTEASKYFRWACSSGDAEACIRRGDLLVSDVGVRRDDHEALNMYQRACDGAIARGCTEGGRIVHEGTYVKQDLALAASLYGRGCDGASARGCFGLGTVSEKGAGVGAPDMVAARDAYERAVGAGSLEAKPALARLLWNGYGGKKSRGQAKQLCREACQAGDALSCRGPSFLRN